MSALTESPQWAHLTQLARATADAHLRDWFAADAQRFARFSLHHGDWLLDYSKQRINAPIMAALHALWHCAQGPQWLARLRAGEAINHTEQRAVFHHALRSEAAQELLAGHDVLPAVRAVLARMAQFCGAIHSGQWRGASLERIDTVVNIGIGGSDLGPQMVVAALAAHRLPGLHVHFVSNVDAAHLAGVLAQCAPQRTLFLIASKTFSTEETMANAASARCWLVAALGEAAVAQHFVALSGNPAAAARFGITAANTFTFPEWVGGRFSLWSAIGLPIALALGMDNFRALLAGGAAMDAHFFATPAERNLPLTLALLDLWNRDFLAAPTRALLPYSQSLALLPAYVQQLEMESNGKSVTRAGTPLTCASAPIVWGAAGSNGQHAFYQLIHQGGQCVPCEFIAFAHGDFSLPEPPGAPDHQQRLLAHCLAQSEALMRGRTLAEVRALAEGAVPPKVSLAAHAPAPDLAPYKVFPGNQPSTTLLLPRLDPFHLGQLLALYEHKVFCLGVLWQINAFDQWGVEYGKELAAHLLPLIDSELPCGTLDSSSAGLLAAVRRLRAKKI